MASTSGVEKRARFLFTHSLATAATTLARHWHINFRSDKRMPSASPDAGRAAGAPRAEFNPSLAEQRSSASLYQSVRHWSQSGRLGPVDRDSNGSARRPDTRVAGQSA